MKKSSVILPLFLLTYISLFIFNCSCSNNKNKREIEQQNTSTVIEETSSDFILERLHCFMDRNEGFYEIIREPIIKEKIISQKSTAYYQSLIDNVDMNMGGCELENGLYVAKGAVKGDGSWPAESYLTYNPSNREFTIFYLRSDGSEIGMDGNIYQNTGTNSNEIVQAFSLVQSQKPVFDVYDLIESILTQKESIKSLSIDNKAKLSVIILYIKSKVHDMVRGLSGGMEEWEEVDSRLNKLQQSLASSLTTKDLDSYHDLLNKMSGNAKELLASNNDVKSTESNPTKRYDTSNKARFIEPYDMVNAFQGNSLKAERDYPVQKRMDLSAYIKSIKRDNRGIMKYVMEANSPDVGTDIYIFTDDEAFVNIDFPKTINFNAEFDGFYCTDRDIETYIMVFTGAHLR